MKTKILKVSRNNPSPEVIREASEALLAGGVVIYPADTVYSLAVSALDDRAVAKVFNIKGRDPGKPIHVLVKDLKMLEELVEVNSEARKLIENFVPGYLNLVLRDKGVVSELLVSKFGTLGVRIPDCKLTKKLSDESGIPYTGTSANPAGGKSPYSLEDILSQFSAKFLSKIDLILDAGVLPKVLPSTVVDLTGDLPKMLREGPIRRETIEAILGKTL